MQPIKSCGKRRWARQRTCAPTAAATAESIRPITTSGKPTSGRPPSRRRRRAPDTAAVTAESPAFRQNLHLPSSSCRLADGGTTAEGGPVKRASSLVGVALVSLLAGSQPSHAQVYFPFGQNPPDIVRSFRLIPSKSTLEQTGGFAGFNFDYTLFGKFEVRTGYESGVTCAAIGCPPPPWYPVAKFENVRVSAFLNDPRAFAFPIPLSQFVDLEELRGTFRPEEPRRLIFHGEDNQGAPFALLAV